MKAFYNQSVSYSTQKGQVKMFSAMQEGLIEAFGYMEYREEARRRFTQLMEVCGGNNKEAMRILSFRAKRRQAKRIAKEIGLAYWPALIDMTWGPNVDPAAYVAAEKAMCSTHGLYGEIMEDGTRSHGGWDSKGHHGVDRHEIARYWYAAGCKDTPKFRAQVRARIESKKGESLKEFLDYIRGYRWLKGNFKGYEPAKECGEGVFAFLHSDVGDDHHHFSRKAVRALGRLSPVLRWMVIRDLPDTEDVSVLRTRHLNWEEVHRVQALPRWKKVREMMPIRLKWKILKGVDAPVGLEKETPIRVKLGVYESLCKDAQVEPYKGVQGQEMRLPLLNLTRLFESVGEVKRFASLMGVEWNQGGLHDLGQFVLPEQGWTAKEWRRLVFKHPEVLKGAGAWAYIEKKLGHVPQTLREFKDELTLVEYDGIETEGDMEVAKAGVLAGLSPFEFLKYRDYFRETPVKGFETIPHVEIRGEEIGLEGDWVLRKLDADDPIGPMLGFMTDCCQHLHGAGKECAMDGYESPWSGFYIVEYKGSLIAQSWAWRSSSDNGWADDDTTPHKALVFDSIEALGNAYVEGISKLYREAAKRIVGRLGIKEVRFGATGYGITREVGLYLGMDEPKEDVWPYNYSGYMDGARQWIIRDEGAHPFQEQGAMEGV